MTEFTIALLFLIAQKFSEVVSDAASTRLVNMGMLLVRYVVTEVDDEGHMAAIEAKVRNPLVFTCFTSAFMRNIVYFKLTIQAV